MREEQLRRFAAELGIINFRPRTRNGWLETNCPLAEWTHEKGTDNGASFALMVNNSGRSYHRCLSCGAKGSFAKLAYDMFGYSQEQVYQDIGHQIEAVETTTMAESLPEWEDFEFDQQAEINRQFLDEGRIYRNYPPAFYYKRCLTYMRSRGIRPWTSLRLNLRYDYAEDRLLFPVIDRNLELRGLSGRAMYSSDAPDHIKVKDYEGLNKVEVLLGEDRVFKNRLKYKFVIVVEGLIDYAKVLQAGFDNVVCLLGNQMTKQKYDKLIDLDLPIVWFMDNDEGGYSCIYGVKDKKTGEREVERGALHMFGSYFPNMIVKYPKKLKAADPGSLDTPMIRKLVYSAEVHI